MIDEWLAQYKINANEDLIFAKREIMQEIVLAGLARGEFFKHATFYGGAALRIFHKLERYSEDLDFSLNYQDENFTLEKYFQGIKDEFAILGLDVVITLKEKKNISQVESAFLKENTIWGMIALDPNMKKVSNFPNVKIKVEIDKTPPLKFSKEFLEMTRPYSFHVACMTLPSLFAGKMHAVLFREWKHRVKGRDWYDLDWYVQKRVPLKLNEFIDRGLNSGHLSIENSILTVKEFRDILFQRIEKLDVETAKMDIEQFIPNAKQLAIWSKQYFHDLVDKLIIE